MVAHTFFRHRLSFALIWHLNIWIIVLYSSKRGKYNHHHYGKGIRFDRWIVQCRAASSCIKDPIGPYLLDWWFSIGWLFSCKWWFGVFNEAFSWRYSAPCCVSIWRRRSTFRWNARRHLWHWNGLKPVCFRLCVIKFDDWEKAFPQTIHLCGFSPRIKEWDMSISLVISFSNCFTDQYNWTKQSEREREKERKW